MKKMILIFATIIVLFLGMSTVSAEEKYNGNILLDKGKVNSITEKYKFLNIFIIRFNIFNN